MLRCEGTWHQKRQDSWAGSVEGGVHRLGVGDRVHVLGLWGYGSWAGCGGRGLPAGFVGQVVGVDISLNIIEYESPNSHPHPAQTLLPFSLHSQAKRPKRLQSGGVGRLEGYDRGESKPHRP